MKYKIAKVYGNTNSVSKKTLEEVVQELVDEGYRPIGGVSISLHNNEFVFAQALIKEETFQWDSDKTETQVG